MKSQIKNVLQQCWIWASGFQNISAPVQSVIPDYRSILFSCSARTLFHKHLITQYMQLCLLTQFSSYYLFFLNGMIIKIIMKNEVFNTI